MKYVDWICRNCDKTLRDTKVEENEVLGLETIQCRHCKAIYKVRTNRERMEQGGWGTKEMIGPQLPSDIHTGLFDTEGKDE